MALRSAKPKQSKSKSPKPGLESKYNNSAIDRYSNPSIKVQSDKNTMTGMLFRRFAHRTFRPPVQWADSPHGWFTPLTNCPVDDLPPGWFAIVESPTPKSVDIQKDSSPWCGSPTSLFWKKVLIGFDNALLLFDSFHTSYKLKFTRNMISFQLEYILDYLRIRAEVVYFFRPIKF